MNRDPRIDPLPGDVVTASTPVGDEQRRVLQSSPLAVRFLLKRDGSRPYQGTVQCSAVSWRNWCERHGAEVFRG